MVSDQAAVAFARGFYAALAHGRDLDEAVSAGRIAILGTGSDTLEWITPVMYLRGDETRLFTLPPANGKVVNLSGGPLMIQRPVSTLFSPASPLPYSGNAVRLSGARCP